MDLMPKIGHRSQEVAKGSLVSASKARNSTAFFFNFNQLIAKIQGSLPKGCWLTSHAKHEGGVWGLLTLLAVGSQLSEHLWKEADWGTGRSSLAPSEREAGKKRDEVANVVRATAMEMCSCLPLR